MSTLKPTKKRADFGYFAVEIEHLPIGEWQARALEFRPEHVHHAEGEKHAVEMLVNELRAMSDNITSAVVELVTHYGLKTK